MPSLSWLTEQAIKCIEEELQERDWSSRSLVDPHAPASTLTLTDVYQHPSRFEGDPQMICVTIEATKLGDALYSFSKCVWCYCELGKQMAHNADGDVFRFAQRGPLEISCSSVSDFLFRTPYSLRSSDAAH